MRPLVPNPLRKAICASCLLVPLLGHAALFADDEARQMVFEVRQQLDKFRDQSQEDTQQLRKSLLEFIDQMEKQRAEVSALRGEIENLTREKEKLKAQITIFNGEQQKLSKSQFDLLDERMKKLEPELLVIDGKEALVEPAEKREFEQALAIFRKGEFNAAVTAFTGFNRHFPKSAYSGSVQFWLGAAYYGLGNYREAIVAYRALLALDAHHPKAADAMLSMGLSFVDLKDSKTAKQTFSDLLKKFPDTEAAAAAKVQLSKLK